MSYVDPTPECRPDGSGQYVSQNEDKVMALKKALWELGDVKVMVVEDKRTDPDDPEDTQAVWVLFHSATDFQFSQARKSIPF